MFKKVIKDTSLISAGTLVSRILGFIRDMILSRFFGDGTVLEAFLVAFRLPNLFRSVFAEGFSDAVAVPILSEHNKDNARIFEIGNHLISVFSVILTVFTILGIICSRWLILLIAPGFNVDPTRFEMAVSFARITFVYLLLIGISCNAVAVLYSLRKFFIPAINPVFLNITFIPGVIFFSRYFKDYILVICVVVAGILEVLFPFLALKKESFRFKFNFAAAVRDSEIIRMFKLFIPRIGSSIVYQLNIFVDTIFSSYIPVVGVGAVAAVYFANRFIQFPFALIALAISQVVVVDLSRHHKDDQLEDFKKLFVFAFQNIIFFIIPVAVCYIFLSQEIIDVFFKGGKFGDTALKATSSVLFFYSFGLFFSCGARLLNTCFYAIKDTRLPAITATVALIVNVFFNFILMYPLKIAGIALATSISGLVNFILLYFFLIKKIGKIDWQDTALQLVKVIFLSLAIGVFLKFMWSVLVFNKYLKMGCVLSLGFIMFVFGGFFLRLKQAEYFREKLQIKNYS